MADALILGRSIPAQRTPRRLVDRQCRARGAVGGRSAPDRRGSGAGEAYAGKGRADGRGAGDPGPRSGVAGRGVAGLATLPKSAHERS